MAGVRVALPAGEMVWVRRRVDTGLALDRSAVDAFLVELYRCRRCFFTSCVTATMLDHLHQNHGDGSAATSRPATPAVTPCQSPSSPATRVSSSSDAGPCRDADAAPAAETFFSGADECGGSAADTSATGGAAAAGSCADGGDADARRDGAEASPKVSAPSAAERTAPRGSRSEQGDHPCREERGPDLAKGDGAGGGGDPRAECGAKQQAAAAPDGERAGGGIESAACGPDNLERISREVDRMLRCLSPESCEMIGLVGGCHDDVDAAGFFEAMMEAARPLPTSRDEADEAQSEHLFSLGLCRTTAMARRPQGWEPNAKMRCVPPNLVCEAAALTVKTPDACVQPGSQAPVPEVEKSNNVFSALDAVCGNAAALGNAGDGEEACYSSLVVDLSAGAGTKRKKAPRKTSHPRCNVKKSCAKTAADKRQEPGRKPVKLGLTRVSQSHPRHSQPALDICSEDAAFMDPCFRKDDADWVVLNAHQQLDDRLSEKTLSCATARVPKRRKQRDRACGAKSVKRFRCPECQRMFVSQPLRDIHVACHRPQGFKCHYCDFSGRKWKRMRKHLLTHNPDSPVRSSDSPRVPSLAARGHPPHGGASPVARSAHGRSQGRTPDSCENSRVAPNPRSNRNCKCTTCGRECSSKKAMYRHAKTHTGDKPYVCSQCGHRTRLKASLDMHVRTHTGEKPFQCELCPYSSSDASCLRRHKRTHTSEKPHKCALCSYTCIQKKCLDTHMRRTHTGEFLTCPRCPFSTFNRQSLGRHLARHGSSAKQPAAPPPPQPEIPPRARRVRRGGREQPRDVASEKTEAQAVADWLTATM